MVSAGAEPVIASVDKNAMLLRRNTEIWRFMNVLAIVLKTIERIRKTRKFVQSKDRATQSFIDFIEKNEIGAIAVHPNWYTFDLQESILLIVSSRRFW